MDWVVNQLAHSNDIKLQKNGQGGRCTLTERGQESLVATDQFPSLEFRLKGKQLNALREAICLVTTMDASDPEPDGNPPVTVEPDSASTPFALSVGDVLEAFEELRRERFSEDGVVPIYELRRHLIARFGPESGSHPVLDPLLFHLRKENRLRMIPIAALGRASQEQLAESVHGESEIFFSVEAVHEYAHRE